MPNHIKNPAWILHKEKRKTFLQIFIWVAWSRSLHLGARLIPLQNPDKRDQSAQATQALHCWFFLSLSILQNLFKNQSAPARVIALMALPIFCFATQASWSVTLTQIPFFANPSQASFRCCILMCSNSPPVVIFLGFLFLQNLPGWFPQSSSDWLPSWFSQVILFHHSLKSSVTFGERSLNKASYFSTKSWQLGFILSHKWPGSLGFSTCLHHTST